MSVTLTMRSGDRYVLDRNLAKHAVAEKINEARGKGKLIAFESDRTPTGQMIWIDPDQVVVVDDPR